MDQQQMMMMWQQQQQRQQMGGPPPGSYPPQAPPMGGMGGMGGGPPMGGGMRVAPPSQPFGAGGPPMGGGMGGGAPMGAPMGGAPMGGSAMLNKGMGAGSPMGGQGFPSMADLAKNSAAGHTAKTVEDNEVKVMDPRGQLVQQVSRYATFEEAPFPRSIKDQLLKAGFPAPSQIQQYTWPLAFQGRDTIGVAATGSGKTLAFLLPAFTYIMEQNIRAGEPIFLCLAPTRELAVQIEEESVKFGRSSGIKTTCCYGGAPKHGQAADIRSGVHGIIGTPGRVNDFLEGGQLRLGSVCKLVLDEADRMLDMGFEPQIRKILNQVPRQRHTLFFTATWPQSIRRMASEFLKDPYQVQIGNRDELKGNQDIVQMVKICTNYNKSQVLNDVLRQAGVSDRNNSQSKGLVFCSTKRMCDQIADQLRRGGVPCDAIHGDKDQRSREKALNDLKSSQIKLLVATDVAARGIDIKGVTLVVNYDAPSNTEDYVHRIGRTGRAGQKGYAILLVTDRDAHCLRGILEVMKRTNQEITPEVEAMAKNAGPAPPPIRRGNKGGGGGFGGGGEGGKGMRGRRDDGPATRADDGDWFARDRPSGGGRGGDREEGGKGMGRGGDRRGDPDAEAEKDNDWRGGGRDDGPRRGGFGDRDRDDRGGGFGRDRDGPSERPRLQLKPRSKPVDGEEGGEDSKPRSNPFGGATAREDKKKDDDDTGDDEKEEQPKKWIPPSQRARMEEENAKKKEQEEADREDRRRIRESEEARRSNKAGPADADGFSEVRRPASSAQGGASKSGGYIPPAQRAAREAEEKRAAEREAREKEAEERQRAKDEAKKKEAALLKAKKQEEADARKAELKEEMERRNASGKVQKASKDDDVVVDKAKISAWSDKCEALVKDAKDPKKLADEADSILGENELKSAQPIRSLLSPLIRSCKTQSEKEVVATMKKYAPLIKKLCKLSGVHRFKVKVLCEAQRVCSEIHLPRLTPATALIEAVFDGLYSAEVIEEQYFEFWAIHNDDTPGKTSAMFQLSDFLEWLRNGKYEGESSSEEEDDEGEGAEEEEQSDEDVSDIEANVPKRAGARPLR